MLTNDTASLKGFLTTLHQRAVLPARPALHLLWRQTCFPELQNMLMTAVLDTSSLETRVGCLDRDRRKVCSCRVPSVFGPTADPDLQDEAAESGRTHWPPPRRVPDLDSRGNAVKSALVMPRPPCVLRTVLPGAVQDFSGVCLILSGHDPALVPGDDAVLSCSFSRNHVKTTQRTETLQLLTNLPCRKTHDTSTPWRLQHHTIDDTILMEYAHPRCQVHCRKQRLSPILEHCPTSTDGSLDRNV